MNIKRMRGRNHRGNGGGPGGGTPIRQQSGNVPMNRNHVFDSSGPDLRIRGTSQQLFEKYLQLGRDATGSGDRVMAESYFQYAEHYFRILNAMNQAAQQNERQAGPQQGSGQPYQRRQESQQDYNGNKQGGSTQGSGSDDESEGSDSGAPGSGEQPTLDARPIPIAAGSPE